MKMYLYPIFFLSFSGLAFAGCDESDGLAEISGAEGSKIILSSWDCRIRAWGAISYQRAEIKGSLYSTSASSSSQGWRTLVSALPENLSQDRKTLMVQRVVVGEVYLENGSKKETESNYCDVIDMETGCVSKRLPGDSCAGSWVEGKWKPTSGEEQDEAGLELPTESPRKVLDRVSKVKDKVFAISNHLYMGVDSYLACYPPDKKNIVDLNNMAFYLAEGGDNYNSLKIYRALEKVAPSRTVLKINIADALWGSGDKESARAYYREYESAMVRAGMKDKIPSRVGVRIDYAE